VQPTLKDPWTNLWTNLIFSTVIRQNNTQVLVQFPGDTKLEALPDFGDEDVTQNQMILKSELTKPQQNLFSTKCKDRYSGTSGPDSENPGKVCTSFCGIRIPP